MTTVEDHLARDPAPAEVTNAFWCVCHGGRREAAEYLLERGADLNWVGHDRLTPLDAAARSHATELVAWLRTPARDPPTQTVTANEARRLAIVQGARIADPYIAENILTDGGRCRVSWFDPPFRPPLEQTRHALGVCFTCERKIVLVTWNDRDWSLPGGTVEPGETLGQTLVREVREEACARVVDCAYIGCQLVEELDADLAPYYQTRFWARVELQPFLAEHEMTGRRLVAPEVPPDALLG
jgi:8-oxo-dGTP pyrophosphatase MutT (NUDIX family)